MRSASVASAGSQEAGFSCPPAGPASPAIEPPLIDRRAAEGMRFTQFYSGANVCAPSRSVLMTGLHTGHTPVRNNGLKRHLAHDDVTVAASCDGAFVRPARAGQRLVADAVERIRHGRSGIYDVTVTAGGGEVVAEFRGRSRTLGRPILDDNDHPAMPGA